MESRENISTIHNLLLLIRSAQLSRSDLIYLKSVENKVIQTLFLKSMSYDSIGYVDFLGHITYILSVQEGMYSITLDVYPKIGRRSAHAISNYFTS